MDLRSTETSCKLNDHSTPRNDLEVFLKSQGFAMSSVEQYPLGIASENYRVICADGKDLTVRVDHRRKPAEVTSDAKYMEVARNAGIRVPEDSQTIEEFHGGTISVRSTIPGESFVHSFAATRPRLIAVGDLLARVHLAAERNLPPRKYFYNLLFQRANPAWLQIDKFSPLMDDNASLRALLNEARRLLLAASAAHAKLRQSQRGVMHGDFTPSNLLLVPDGSLALLDWEKACLGYQQSDVAQGMFHFAFLNASETPSGSVEAFLTGYAARRPLEGVDSLPLWMSAYASSFIMRDAAFAGMNRVNGSSYDARREKYFFSYCVPAFEFFLAHQSEILGAIRVNVI